MNKAIDLNFPRDWLTLLSFVCQIHEVASWGCLPGCSKGVTIYTLSTHWLLFLQNTNNNLHFYSCIYFIYVLSFPSSFSNYRLQRYGITDCIWMHLLSEVHQSSGPPFCKSTNGDRNDLLGTEKHLDKLAPLHQCTKTKSWPRNRPLGQTSISLQAHLDVFFFLVIFIFVLHRTSQILSHRVIHTITLVIFTTSNTGFLSSFLCTDVTQPFNHF